MAATVKENRQGSPEFKEENSPESDGVWSREGQEVRRSDSKADIPVESIIVVSIRVPDPRGTRT
jgi:hypothetical protein